MTTKTKKVTKKPPVALEEPQSPPEAPVVVSISPGDYMALVKQARNLSGLQGDKYKESPRKHGALMASYKSEKQKTETAGAYEKAIDLLGQYHKIAALANPESSEAKSSKALLKELLQEQNYFI